MKYCYNRYEFLETVAAVEEEIWRFQWVFVVHARFEAIKPFGFGSIVDFVARWKVRGHTRSQPDHISLGWLTKGSFRSRTQESAHAQKGKN